MPFIVLLVIVLLASYFYKNYDWIIYSVLSLVSLIIALLLILTPLMIVIVKKSPDYKPSDDGKYDGAMLFCMVLFGAVFLIPPYYQVKYWYEYTPPVVEEAPVKVYKEPTKDQMFGVAAHILALGKVKGCGEFEVTNAIPDLERIYVKCGNGREYSLKNGSMLEIDGW